MKPIEAVRASTSKGGDRGGAATSTHHSFATTLNCLGATTRGGATREPDTSTTAFTWDGNSNLTSVTPPGKPQHGQAFTKVDQLSGYTPPAVPGITTPATTFAYNVDRQLTTTTRPDGLVTTRTYNSAGKLDLLQTPTGNVDYDYFGLTPCPGCAPGRLQRITDPSGVILSHTYDGSLLTSLTWSGAVNGAVSFTYDDSFRNIGETVTVGATSSPIVFGYDPDDITICASPTSCSPAGTDALSVSLDSQNGRVTGSTLGTVSDLWTYNAYGELAKYEAAASGSTVFSEIVDTVAAPRDALGRIVTRAEVNGPSSLTFGYTYDSRGRLTAVSVNGSPSESYVYDANGNRTSFTSGGSTVTGTYDAQDRLLTYGNLSYTYTANGELRTKTDSATSETTTYTYDVRGNLTRVDLPSGDVIEYLLDGQDRRVGKKRNGTLEKQWLYKDGLNIVAELDGTGNLVSRFVYASKPNIPAFMMRGGVTYRIISDHLGSPRVIVNVSTGAVTWRANFDAWGNRTLIAGVGDFVPFGFAGGQFDGDTGLTRFGARDYDPNVGRWTSKDPIGFEGGVALYGYSNFDPINEIDPSGLVPEECDDKKCTVPCEQLFTKCGLNCFDAYGYDSVPGTTCLACCSAEFQACKKNCKPFFPSTCVDKAEFPASSP